MNNLQVLVRCYDKVATRSVSATCYFGREAPARVTRRAARRYCPGLAGAGLQRPAFPAGAEGRIFSDRRKKFQVGNNSFTRGKVTAPGRRHLPTESACVTDLKGRNLQMALDGPNP